MEQFKKVTLRIKGDTYERINASHLSAGAEVDKTFCVLDERAQRIAFLEEQVLQLQKEKRVLLDVSNQNNIMLDVLNSLADGLNLNVYKAHDEQPHTTVESAITKQKQRVTAMRHYTK